MSELDMKIFLQAKENSIGNDKKDKLVTNKKSISKKLLIGLIATLLTLSMCACSNDNSININYRAVDYYKSNVCLELVDVFKENDMEYDQASNSLAEYVKIEKYLNEDNMLIYYDFLGKVECDKIAHVLGYKDLEDYLIKNGYCDKQGNPSIGVLRDSTYDRITQEAEKTK